MRLLVQRSKESSVWVDGKLVGSIPSGLVVLVGFTQTDTEKEIDYLLDKLIHLRIFNDEEGKMNLSVQDVKGSILSISQFTLYADTKKGRRPSYQNALDGPHAKSLYDLWNKKLKEVLPTETGIFGADMQLHITNDGPVTVLLEKENL